MLSVLGSALQRLERDITNDNAPKKRADITLPPPSIAKLSNKSSFVWGTDAMEFNTARGLIQKHFNGGKPLRMVDPYGPGQTYETSNDDAVLQVLHFYDEDTRKLYLRLAHYCAISTMLGEQRFGPIVGTLDGLDANCFLVNLNDGGIPGLLMGLFYKRYTDNIENFVQKGLNRDQALALTGMIQEKLVSMLVKGFIWFGVDPQSIWAMYKAYGNSFDNLVFTNVGVDNCCFTNSVADQLDLPSNSEFRCGSQTLSTDANISLQDVQIIFNLQVILLTIRLKALGKQHYPFQTTLPKLISFLRTRQKSIPRVRAMLRGEVGGLGQTGVRKLIDRLSETINLGTHPTMSDSKRVQQQHKNERTSLYYLNKLYNVLLLVLEGGASLMDRFHPSYLVADTVSADIGGFPLDNSLMLDDFTPGIGPIHNGIAPGMSELTPNDMNYGSFANMGILQSQVENPWAFANSAAAGFGGGVDFFNTALQLARDEGKTMALLASLPYHSMAKLQQLAIGVRRALLMQDQLDHTEQLRLGRIEEAIRGRLSMAVGQPFYQSYSPTVSSTADLAKTMTGLEATVREQTAQIEKLGRKNKRFENLDKLEALIAKGRQARGSGKSAEKE